MLLITAYYPLLKSKHSLDQYRTWIKYFFRSVKCDVICFCPKSLRSFIKNIKSDKTTIVTKEFNSFDMMSSSQMKVWNDFNKIDPEPYHSPELYAVWAAKQEFVREAIKIIDTDIYIWCDIGCFRNIRNASFSAVKSFISPGKISCLSIDNTIGGGVLAGDKYAWNNFSELYLEELNKNPHGKDQVIYKRILNCDNATIIPATNFFGDPWFCLTYLFSFDCFSEIDHVVYINLKHRLDRKEHIESVLSIFPKNKVTRFDAIKHTNGAIGCTKSHIEVLKLAIKNNWNNVLIVEDDMAWNNLDVSSEILKNVLQLNYDVIVLGGTNIKNIDNKLIECQTTTSYLVSKNYYTTLLNNFEEGLDIFIKTNIPSKYAIDQYWKILQKHDNWYIIVPNLSIQIAGYSDIENKNVNYDNMFNLKMALPQQKRIFDHLLRRK